MRQGVSSELQAKNNRPEVVSGGAGPGSAAHLQRTLTKGDTPCPPNKATTNYRQAIAATPVRRRMGRTLTLARRRSQASERGVTAARMPAVKNKTAHGAI